MYINIPSALPSVLPSLARWRVSPHMAPPCPRLQARIHASFDDALAGVAAHNKHNNKHKHNKFNNKHVNNKRFNNTSVKHVNKYVWRI